MNTRPSCACWTPPKKTPRFETRRPVSTEILSGIARVLQAVCRPLPSRQGRGRPVSAAREKRPARTRADRSPSCSTSTRSGRSLIRAMSEAGRLSQRPGAGTAVGGSRNPVCQSAARPYREREPDSVRHGGKAPQPHRAGGTRGDFRKDRDRKDGTGNSRTPPCPDGAIIKETLEEVHAGK